MSAANYRFLPPWLLIKVDEETQSDEKMMEEPSGAAIPLVKRGSLSESLPSVEMRSRYSFDPDEDPAHEQAEQHADTFAQRLL